MRLGQLLTVLFVGMFVTAFFYSVSGAAPTGIDEDCDGEDDFDPLPLWEQAVFAIMASLMQLPASIFLAVLFSMAGDACFLARYFPIWRELELRKVAEVHLGQKVSGLRRKLQVLQTTLANWIEITEQSVTREDIEQLKTVSELLGDENTDRLIDQVIEGRKNQGLLRLQAGGEPAPSPSQTPQRSKSHRQMQSRTQRNATRLQLIRALRDYGDFMAQAYRSELSCMGYAWSWRCADMLGCCSDVFWCFGGVFRCCTDQTAARVRLDHLQLIAELTAKLAPNRDFTDADEQKMVEAISRNARKTIKKNPESPDVYWFMPVQLLPDVYNPAALGWKKSPRSCQVCCCCLVWCCNRMPA